MRMRSWTDRQTDRQTDARDHNFALSATHAKCNNRAVNGKAQSHTSGGRPTFHIFMLVVTRKPGRRTDVADNRTQTSATDRRALSGDRLDLRQSAQTSIRRAFCRSRCAPDNVRFSSDRLSGLRIGYNMVYPVDYASVTSHNQL